MSFAIGDVVCIKVKSGKNKDNLNFGILDYFEPDMMKWRIRLFFGSTKNCFRKNEEMTLICNSTFLYDRLSEMVRGLGVSQ